MSTVTHHLDGTGISSGRPAATRPRDLLRLPVFDARPLPEESAGRPDDEVEDRRRVSGAGCRIAMGYLD